VTIEFFQKPIYGKQAAEVWKDITGNYPVFPPSSREGEGAVLFNTDAASQHLVGMFGFSGIADQVIIFDSYFAAEQFYKNMRENPLAYKSKPLPLPPHELTAEEKKEAEALEAASRPRHMYEGSGSKED
jgi:hypothetical protein